MNEPVIAEGDLLIPMTFSVNEWREIMAGPCSLKQRIADKLQINLDAFNVKKVVKLSPMDEAKVYEKLRKAGQSIKEIARVAECSQRTVENKLYLLTLPLDVQEQIHLGKIPVYKAIAQYKS